MIGLIPAFLGFTAGLLNLFFDRLRPNLPIRWIFNLIIAVLLVAVSFGLGLIAPGPASFQLWQPGSSLDVELIFHFDSMSWALSVGIGLILLLCSIVSPRDPGRLARGRSFSAFSLVGAVFLLVTAQNPVALAAGLFTLDLIQLVEAIFVPFPGTQAEFLRKLYVQLISSGLVLFSLYLPALPASQAGSGLTSWTAGLILLAAGLRLGIFFPRLLGQPWRDPAVGNENDSDGRRLPYGILFSAVSGISGLALIARMPAGEVPSIVMILGLIFALLASLSSILMLVSAPLEENGAGALFSLLSVLAFVAALFSLAEAGLSWSITALFSAGLLAFAGRGRRWIPILTSVILALSIGLPFTPSWAGVQIYSRAGSLVPLLFFVPQSLFSAFQLSRNWRSSDIQTPAGDFQTLLRNVFLAVMLIVFVFFGAWAVVENGWQGNYWSGGVVLLSSLGVFALLRARQLDLQQLLPEALLPWFSLEWLQHLGQILLRPLENVVRLLTNVLEGESGILWSMLLLIILISLLVTLIQV